MPPIPPEGQHGAVLSGNALSEAEAILRKKEGIDRDADGVVSGSSNNSGTSSSSSLVFVDAKSTSFLGIRWALVEGEIERLNAVVESKTIKYVEESRASGMPLAPEVAQVLGGNHHVYKKRWVFLPVFYAFISIAMLAQYAREPLTPLVAFVFSFFWYDFFSGVLHVILDNPSFMKFPVLDEPCLEFQWHHHIPLVRCDQPPLLNSSSQNLPP